MPFNANELIQAAQIVAESKEMTATVQWSLLGAGMTSLTTFIGGLLAGPVGLLAGATSGGLLAYCSTKDKFKPVTQIIKEDLTEIQKQRLIHLLEVAVKDVDITDAVTLALFLTNNEITYNAIFNVIKLFIEGDLRMKLCYKNN